MHCEYCGASLSKNSAICPNCGRMMNNQQLKIKKDINGYDNPYIKRLNDLNQKYEYKLSKSEKTKTVGAAILIVGLMILVMVIAVIIWLNNR